MSAMVGQAAPTSFIPPITSGLVLSLIADNITVSDLANVPTWPDASGAGNDATQVTSSKQGVLHKATWNGHAVVRMDAVDDGYITACNLSNPYTIIIVVTNPTLTGGSTRVVQSVGASALMHPYRSSNTAFNAAAVSNFQSAGSVVACLRIGTVSQYDANGTDETASASQLGNWGVLALGTSGAQIQPAACDIWGIFAFNRALSDTERTTMETAIRAYLAF